MQQRKEAYWIQDEELNNYYCSARGIEDLQNQINAGKYYDAGDFLLLGDDWVEFENFNIVTNQKVRISEGNIVNIIDLNHFKSTLPALTEEEQEANIADVLKLLK